MTELNRGDMWVLRPMTLVFFYFFRAFLNAALCDGLTLKS